MPEAVLAGQNGAPAIDQVTGLPLTMEELLRRRGILAHKGVVSPLNLGGSATPVPTSAAELALADAANATKNNSDGTTLKIGGSPNTLDGNGVPVQSTPATPIDPTSGDGSNMWPWLAGGTTAAGAALYAANRMRKRTPGLQKSTAEGVRINRNLFREPTDVEFEPVPTNERRGSNRKLDPLIDPKNVSRAGEVGAGPKALSGAAPVTDTSRDGVRGAMVERAFNGKQLPDYAVPGAFTSTRMQNAARQANNSRVQPSNDNPLLLTDQFTDLDANEMTVARQIAARLRSERERGMTKQGRVPGRSTSGSSVPIAPVYDQRSELHEAVALVRRMRSEGVDVKKIIPRIRLFR